MDRPDATLERAFELATSGKHRTLEEIYWQLKQEGYDLKPFAGSSLIDKVKSLIKKPIHPSTS